MKKFFMILLAAATLVGMVCSCDKGNDNKKKGDKEGGEEEAAALIDIDGAFTDWDALKDAVTLTAPEKPYYPDLKKAKLAADDNNIYAYIEYEIQEGQELAPINFQINADMKDDTGAKNYLFTGTDGIGECGYEYCIESEAGFYKEGKIVPITDGVLYEYIGPDGGDAWDDPVEGFEQDPDTGCYLKNIGGGLLSCAGVLEGSLAKVEFAISREDMEFTSSSIKIGIITFIVPPADWETSGSLPQLDGETSVGAAPLVELSL